MTKLWILEVHSFEESRVAGKIMDVIAWHTNKDPDEIRRETLVENLGSDVLIAKISQALDGEFGFRKSNPPVKETRTVGAIIDYVIKHRTQ